MKPTKNHIFTVFIYSPRSKQRWRLGTQLGVAGPLTSIELGGPPEVQGPILKLSYLSCRLDDGNGNSGGEICRNSTTPTSIFGAFTLYEVVLTLPTQARRLGAVYCRT